MRKIRNEFQTCFDLFLFSLVSISSFFSLIDWFDFYLFCQMKPTINWFSHFISSDHLFDLFDLIVELIDGNRIKMIINWFVCLFVCFKFSWMMMMNQISSSHSYFYSLTYSDLALLIDLIGDWWLIVEISLKWLISLISNFIIDWLIWLNHLTLIEPSQMKLMFILIAFSFHLMFHSFEFIWID